MQDIGRELVGKPPRVGKLKKNEFWALQDINFQLQRGSAMGLVGTNGGGKTTLMRIMAGIIKPTTGQVTVRGRLAPLLALGAGFNAVLTGRENIYTNMSILGLTKDEIDEQFDAVVDYSEIGYALDAPVQTYSSGMTARLGFACAIHTQPDLLLMDEVLAVGDMQFREKCIRTLQKLRGEGTSFIIVHHFPDVLLAVCDVAMYVSKGEVVEFGQAGRVLETYESDLHLKRDDDHGSAIPRRGERSMADAIGRAKDVVVESEDISVLSVEMHAAADLPGDGQTDAEGLVVQNEVASELRIGLRVSNMMEHLDIEVQVMRLPTMETVAQSMTELEALSFSARRDGCEITALAPGEHRLRLNFPWIGLLPGLYQTRVTMTSNGSIIARRRGEKFRVKSNFSGGASDRYVQPRRWELASEPASRESADASLDWIRFSR